MSKIIAVNAGSSSLKFQLLEMPSENVLLSGIIERIGMNDANFTMKFNNQKKEITQPILNHQEAVSLLLDGLIKENIVKNLGEINAIGHRIVHGGEIYKTSILIDDEVAKNIDELSDLAPLHNPANLTGYYSFKKALPNVPHVAVFDTAFHQTMDPATYLYPIPYELYQKYQIRRYGFHGTSHLYVSNRAIELLSNPKESKIITCHLGNGASLAAVKNGKSINTSMGFTPLAGVMMGTRSGDIDPAIITFLSEKLKISAEEVLKTLNKKSGLLGISELSSDARDIDKAILAGNQLARLARDMYVNSVVDRIGSYFVKLGGVDAIVFTAGLGENDAGVRAEICHKLQESLGVKLDESANNTRGKETLISTNDSKVKVYIIPTNEELVIVRDTAKITGL